MEHAPLHASLEVLVLALGQMTQPGGFAAALPLTHRTAIASAASLLDEASKLIEYLGGIRLRGEVRVRVRAGL